MAQGISQKELADRLALSASYVNLLERGRRPVTTELLLKLARVLDVDLRALGTEDSELISAVMEAVADPVLEDHDITANDVRELVAAQPAVARALQRLHAQYARTREALANVGAELLAEESEGRGLSRVTLASEQVSDFIERHKNYFPALEEAAERLWKEAQLDNDTLFGQLKTFLRDRYGVTVHSRRPADMDGAMRRFSPERRQLHLSEALSPQSRAFQLALQTGLLECKELLNQLTEDPSLKVDGARDLCRVRLASYFAAAVMMPYDAFYRAAEASRYDIEMLGRQFGVVWEQACHRLTTLRRPGAEGVSFYMLRVDIAGNISKRFSAAGIRFPRFSGLCTLWNVQGAFLQPGRVRVQLSALPDGKTVLAIARTVKRETGGYHPTEILYSVGIGCDVSQARRLVYSDSLNLENLDGSVPIGITCRLCERTNCAARAFPSVREPLRIDENVRGVSFYAPVGQ